MIFVNSGYGLYGGQAAAAPVSIDDYVSCSESGQADTVRSD
jgi:hypothetical protein